MNLSSGVSAVNPRVFAARGQAKRFALGNVLLPAALLFTIGGIAFTLKWNSDRQKEGVCIDCARQRRMLDEVYSDKPKDRVQKGYRL